RVLYDMPDAPRPRSDVEAPPRFLPEFDNLLLSHVDRAHVVSDEHRAFFMANNFVIGTVLIDGWVGATWRVTQTKAAATLTVDLLGTCGKRTRDQVAAEGAQLLEMFAPASATRDVRVA